MSGVLSSWEAFWKNCFCTRLYRSSSPRQIVHGPRDCADLAAGGDEPNVGEPALLHLREFPAQLHHRANELACDQQTEQQSDRAADAQHDQQPAEKRAFDRVDLADRRAQRKRALGDRVRMDQITAADLHAGCAKRLHRVLG
ncbi:hypothetical protein [Cohnella rhizosphaerae]|uniref:Uncharacterized protein n=1 Tax=Cohnella rhizosphaerae TaxID=1457232 RepID=A0A9X4QS63_9BACL|nr:hypothetical protein [Cohnella rhizosphaerae]MDG0809771.1 hypothetical protein [Cohnella rhizosphaerae]